MGKRILGVVAGLVMWFAVIGIAGVMLRAAWPAYVQASTDMTFTLSMKFARLSIGAVATIAAGITTAVVARSNGAVLMAGALLLMIFIPEHITLWDKFPIWYHLTFLGSLVPLALAGARIARIAWTGPRS